jgi:hypothetical protein
MVLCNQGCGTHVHFKDGEPYNISDNEPHKRTCMSLKIGKWWGGYYNTIPMDMIRRQINEVYEHAILAIESKNVYDIIASVKITSDWLSYVKRKMDVQAERNAKWKDEFMAYKTNLVAEQTLREERKRNESSKKEENRSVGFTTADKL